MNSQPHGPPGFDREREREVEELNRRANLQHQDELAQREREHNERQDRERERQHREQYQSAPPHQNNTGSIPIHQPVASRLPGAIHSPGGLLANHGGAPPSGLGAPSGPGNAFGGPLHSDANRSIQHNPQNATNQLQQQQGFPPGLLHHNTSGGPPTNAVGFGGPLQQQQQDGISRLQQALPFGAPIAPGHPIPGAPALGQGGQQPILNDALSYLDQVKVQFSDQPDVYNKFLDIMKDFKSQAIDTPGVINRVSELFAGHPNLIQGFNTFLPPGYRIECGAGNDPNTIRVTTPMGTTVQSITGTGRALPEAGSLGAPGGGYYSSQRPGNWQQPQHSIESPEGVFSPQAQNAAPAYGQASGPHAAYEAQQQAAAAAAHQQQQRGVSQLTNAVAAVGHPPRNALTPTPGGQPNSNGAAQPGMEKRGPVEFNHAISYVNKIKNRFQDRPEIYKQFLEILQTYQRESKPIQDVYQQVTLLFGTAPDLLEDFKQFLPESAAQAKAAAAAKAAEEAQQNQTPNPRGPPESKMPPVGNFAVPASTSKENNKKRPRNSAAASASQSNAIAENSRSLQNMPPNKRMKMSNKSSAPDAPLVSPTLTPTLPVALPPSISVACASQEELQFFDRVRKHISNKASTNEFLKLCNLFSQDLIDREVLVSKVSVFIGGNEDLMKFFKNFVECGEPERIIENKPKAPTGRVSLSNCRGLGPSYRLLPERESLKLCSGRDEMCQAVLNDHWASHPTWASEDSGFVAHRKNIFEEGLHRIEEERHDYDFNIEANAKVIQLLEPIAQSLLAMNTEDRENFRMPLGLGGQSQAIYKRVLKKVYGERGPEVVADLFRDPCAVLPIVLARLKQKDEEWRFTQREWDKVWQAQTQAMYLKSLDHMGIQVKQTDKKNFSAKHLVDAIKTKHEEQRRQKATGGRSQQAQFSAFFDDQSVITDLLRFMVLYATSAHQHNGPERRRIVEFFEKFISTFFDIPEEQVAICTKDIDRGSPDDDSEDVAPTELPNGRGRKPGKKNDLRRGVLDRARNGTRGRGHKEDSGSKESTPDVDSAADDDTAEAAHDPGSEITNERWTQVPTAIGNTNGEDLELKADQPHERITFSMYANQTIFVFFSVFKALYQRLREIKESEVDAKEESDRLHKEKPAKDLGLINEAQDFFGRPADGETFYAQALRLIEEFVTGEIEEKDYHDWLRRFYLKKGWQLYTIMDLLKSLCRLGVVASSHDPKEKTPDLIEQWYHNRVLEETTYNTEITMKKQAEKYIKDGELFRINWAPKTREATIEWLPKDQTTFYTDKMSRKEKWKYYTSSFIRVDATEGIPRNRLQRAVLARNRAGSNEIESEDSGVYSKAFFYKEDLTAQICLDTYKMKYKVNTTDFFIWSNKPLGFDQTTDDSLARERLRKYENIRNDRFKTKFEMNNAWMKGMDRDAVAKINNDFQLWTKDGVLPGTAPAAPTSDESMVQ